MKKETKMEFIDPICKMKVAPETAAAKFGHNGKIVYFCSQSCLEKYKKQIEMQPQPAQISRIRPTDAELEAVANSTAIDPICGMSVNKATAAARFEHNGETVYFCSKGCLEKYKSQVSGEKSDSKKIVKHGAMKAAPDGEFIDPVCGMSVAPETSAGNYDFNSETYYFCSTGCLNKFKQNPAAFLEKKKEEKLEAESEGTEYTCPMHPEVVQIGPGSCPFCGMALEPKTFSLDDAPDPEYVDMKRRFWIAAALTLPVFLLAMAEMIPWFSSQNLISPKTILWIQFILATPVVLYCGFPFFERGWASVKNKSPNMFTLIAIGTGAAYLYSIVALLFPEIFPASMRDAHTNLIAVYFESAAVIITLVLLGQVLELRARSQTSSAIKELLGLAPKTARVVFDDGSEEEIALEDVQIGAKLRVKANEKFRLTA